MKQDCMDDAWYSFFNLSSFDSDLKNMRSCIHFRKKNEDTLQKNESTEIFARSSDVCQKFVKNM